MSSYRRKRARDCSLPTDGQSREKESLAAIVRAYRQFNRPRVTEELESFRSESSLAAAVARAGAACRPDGKRYDHQRRLSPATIDLVRHRLTAGVVRICQTFDELHERISVAIGNIRGVGELMLYDTSLRIGAKMGLRPRAVYLHRGTRSGARALGFDGRVKTLAVSSLPSELRTLAPHEIEDVLCIYKDRLATTARK